MRYKLAKWEGQRRAFTGVFARLGTKTGNFGDWRQTVLLKDVADVETGEMVTDHLWLNYTRGFMNIEPLRPGDQVQFVARVEPYYKVAGDDYCLRYPSKVQKVGVPPSAPKVVPGMKEDEWRAWLAKQKEGRS